MIIVEKISWELWLGVKFQSNLALAGSLRNVLRYSSKTIVCIIFTSVVFLKFELRVKLYFNAGGESRTKLR